MRRLEIDRKSDGTEWVLIASNFITTQTDGRTSMTTPAGGALNTDFDLMAAIAGKTDARNEEIRAMLQSFIGRMGGVPPSVWGGVAASRFHDVVDRWNAESVKLHAALQRIAETIRLNQQTLREAADTHSHQINAVATNL
jgi:WXG100 family type VII secretion target